MSMIYVGDGSYIVGVPARDLSDAEAERYRGRIVEQQRLTGVVFYVEVVPAPLAARSGGGENGVPPSAVSGRGGRKQGEG